jgi:glutamyl-tRNA reductase
VKRHATAVHIVVFGLNHATAPVDVRERVFVCEADVPAMLAHLREAGLREAVIVSTCNRTEFYFPAPDVGDAAHSVKAFLARRFGLQADWIDAYTYLLHGHQAYRHLFMVASGLDSMVVGEPQILGQIKEAYRLAASNDATDFYLNKAFHRAFHVAKRIRTETRIGYNPVSIASMAVELGKRIFGTFERKKILVIGAGEMCEVALRQFKKEGLAEILITNRTYEAAQRLAEETTGTAHPFNEIPELLTQVDMVLSSTGSEEPIIGLEAVTRAMRRRKNRPLFFIDIAVPRDVDPRVNDLDNTYLYDIDDLKDLAQRHLADRVKESEKALAIIEEETDKFSRWFDRLESTPIITGIVDAVEEVRQAELKRGLQRMKIDDPEQARQIDLLTKSITGKLIHPHLALVRENGSPAVLAMMKRIFRLDERETGEDDVDSGDEG